MAHIYQKISRLHRVPVLWAVLVSATVRISDLTGDCTALRTWRSRVATLPETTMAFQRMNVPGVSEARCMRIV